MKKQIFLTLLTLATGQMFAAETALTPEEQQALKQAVDKRLQGVNPTYPLHIMPSMPRPEQFAAETALTPKEQQTLRQAVDKRLQGGTTPYLLHIMPSMSRPE